MQDGSALEGGAVHVAASLGAGAIREPLHLPGLSLLTAHCTFRGERLTAQLPVATPLNSPTPQQDKQQQGQQHQPPQQEQQQQEHKFESFAALLRALGAAHQLHLSTTEAETSVAFQVR